METMGNMLKVNEIYIDIIISNSSLALVAFDMVFKLCSLRIMSTFGLLSTQNVKFITVHSISIYSSAEYPYNHCTYPVSTRQFMICCI